MTPLEVIGEEAGLPHYDLPLELRRLYGGSLGFETPRLVANFVQTVDGVVAIPGLLRSNAVVAAGSPADRFVMGLLRACADAILVGSGTQLASPQGTWRPGRAFPAAADGFAELRRRRGQPEQATLAFLTGGASLDPRHPALAHGAIVLTTEHAATGLRAAVPPACEVVAVGGTDRVDPLRAVTALRERGHALIVSEAGPHLFGSLVAAGLVDELFLTVSPLLASGTGNGTLSLVEGAGPLPAAAGGRLLSLRRDESHVFLRYAL